MGYERHYGIIVTVFDPTCGKDSTNVHKGLCGDVLAAHKKATEIFGNLVSNIVPSVVNGYQSFLIAPSGGTLVHEKRIEEFAGWLKVLSLSDGSSHYKWVVVQYGDEELITKIIDSSDDEQRTRVLDE